MFNIRFPCFPSCHPMAAKPFEKTSLVKSVSDVRISMGLGLSGASVRKTGAGENSYVVPVEDERDLSCSRRCTELRRCTQLRRRPAAAFHRPQHRWLRRRLFLRRHPRGHIEDPGRRHTWTKTLRPADVHKTKENVKAQTQPMKINLLR